MRDLTMLASEYGDEETRAAAAVALLEREDTVATEGADDDATAAGAAAVEPSPFDDTFVRTFVRGAVHMRRFAPYYLGAAAWVVVMLLMTPKGADPNDGELAGFSSVPNAPLASSAQTTDAPAIDIATPAPGFSDIAAVPSDSSVGFAAAPALDSGGTFADSPTTSSSEFTSSFADSSALDVPDEPEPLRITKSGYSSRTGGTPLEQAPPGNGLPVAAVGGEATKRSFIALSGDETVLKLKLVDDPSNVGAENAGVRACPIVAGWQAERGMSMDVEPAWSTPCVDGTRAEDGTWTFDLSAFGKPGDADGFALTAGTAPGLSFNLTFDTSPVRSG